VGYGVRCMQEPYSYNGKLTTKGALYVEGTKTNPPRAAILAKCPMTLLMYLSDPDFAVAALRDSVEGCPKVWIASMYCEPKRDTVDKLERLCAAAAREDATLVVHADSNAHSVLWGCEKTTNLGDYWEEFVLRSGMFVCNVGRTPTFSNEQGHESIIDVTFTNVKAKQYITDWQVTSDLTYSDHKEIEMKLTDVSTSFPAGPGKPNPKKLNKEVFHQALDKDLRGLSVHKPLDEMAADLQGAIQRAMVSACPQKKPPTRDPVPWWNGTLTHLRKTAHKAFKLYRRERIPKEEYLSKLTTCKTAIKKAKEDSWRDFCTRSNDTDKISALSRAIKRKG